MIFSRKNAYILGIDELVFEDNLFLVYPEWHSRIITVTR